MNAFTNNTTISNFIPSCLKEIMTMNINTPRMIIDLDAGSVYQNVAMALPYAPTYTILTGDGDCYDGDEYPIQAVSDIPGAMQNMTHLMAGGEVCPRATLMEQHPDGMIEIYEWHKCADGSVWHGTPEQYLRAFCREHTTRSNG